MKKSTLAAKAIVTATVGIGFVSAMPAANAGSLIPNREGEIKLTNMACVVSSSDCIDTQQEFGYSVTSLAYKSYATQADKDANKLTTYRASRLFVDKSVTANSWLVGNNNTRGIEFKTQDLGTNTNKDELWLRPVAYDASNRTRENGQLEVGLFRFDFNQAIDKLVFNVFDVESAMKSGITAINGKSISQFFQNTGNNGSEKVTLKNVKSLTMQIGYTGYDSGFETGDGARLAGLQAVPESSTTVSLGLLALAGMFGVSQRKKASKLA
ncbi:LEVG family PEP-CTERM protein [Calothrix sp. PCC 6303]|uniref:LEVG family PEP-CTERM protein n=1 Tax=Calothrix sp. PCC 6303 TaxID=1170562 RepID=UPI0002A01C47|nr:LEVG family PEP-CTERM protein [Calothrix sp. PCC 6303]AFZ04377.1 PEP motif putative anchor domain protein [Calothrix sp. PCC 6303]